MSSIVEVVNLAFVKLGVKRITSIDEATEPARAAKSIFNIIRGAELRANPWAFACKTVRLGTTDEEIIDRWPYVYLFPADYLALVQVGDRWAFNSSECPEWHVENGRLYSDLGPPLVFRYVRRVTEASKFDSLFSVSLACRLAYELCEQLTQATGKRQLAAADRNEAIATALMSNAIERPPQRISDGSWITERA